MMEVITGSKMFGRTLTTLRKETHEAGEARRGIVMQSSPTLSV